MSEAREKLRQIGIQKIYEQTHIPLGHIIALLDDKYEKFTKIQFIGFISILEREYHFDLSDIKESGLLYFNEEKEELTDVGVFIEPKRKKSFAMLYIFLVLLIFIIALVFTFEESETKEIKAEQKIDNVLIQSVEKTLATSDLNDSNETNSSTFVKEESIDTNTTTEFKTPVAENEKIEKSFDIKTKPKVWIGYIDVNTGKRYTKIFKGELILAADKHWLLSFGHPYITIEVNGKVQKFQSTQNRLFEYKNNTIKAISKKEFKKLNRGRLW